MAGSKYLVAVAMGERRAGWQLHKMRRGDAAQEWTLEPIQPVQYV
jgi:hypothetical protein